MMRRRGLAFLLALVLAMTLLPAPVSVRAEDGCRANNWGSHNWELYDPMVDPTCTEAGYGYFVCSYCGIGQERSIPATGHSWSGWYNIRAATCYWEGLDQRVCSVCGEIENRSIGYGAHNWGSWYTEREATCYQQGINARICQDCGEYESYYTGYGEHNWGSWYTEQEATCYQQGINARVCRDCGEYESYYTGYAAHDWGDWYVWKEGSCTERSIMARECRVCGEMESYYDEYGGHSFGDWVTVQEAGPFNTGLKQSVCSVCGETLTEVIEPEGFLTKGDQGPQVEELQEMLNMAGFDCGNVDGDFGNLTEGAVIDYQTANGMEPDGNAWPGMQKHLMSNPLTHAILLEAVSGVKESPYVDGELFAPTVKLSFIGKTPLWSLVVKMKIQKADGSFLPEETVYTMGEGEELAGGGSLDLPVSYSLPKGSCNGENLKFLFYATGMVGGKEDAKELKSEEVPVYISTMTSGKSEDASLMITGKVISDVSSLKKGDLMEVELTATNLGTLPLNHLTVESKVMDAASGYSLWFETIYEDAINEGLAPGASVTFTYFYPVEDHYSETAGAMPFLNFSGIAWTDSAMPVIASWSTADPLFKGAAPEGYGAVALEAEILNPKAAYQSGDELHIELTAANLGLLDLSRLNFTMKTENLYGATEAVHLETTPEDYHLGVEMAYTTDFWYTLMEEDLQSDELLLTILLDAVIDNPSAPEGAGGAGKVWAVQLLTVPMPMKEPPALKLEAKVEGFLTYPLTVDQMVPVTLTVTNTSPSAHVNEFFLFSWPIPMADGDVQDLADHLPVGDLGPGESFSFNYTIMVHPGDIMAHAVERGMKMFGMTVDGKEVESNEASLTLPEADAIKDTDVQLALTLWIDSGEKTSYEVGDEILFGYNLVNLGNEDCMLEGLYQYYSDGALNWDDEAFPTGNLVVAGEGMPLYANGANSITDHFYVKITEDMYYHGVFRWFFKAVGITWSPGYTMHPSNMESYLGFMSKTKPDPELTLTITETSKPANKSFYVEGETITYQYTLENDTAKTFLDVRVHDNQAPEPVKTFAAMPPSGGEIPSWVVEHVVTGPEAEIGSYGYEAYALYVDGSYYEHYIFAGPITSATGKEIPPEKAATPKVELYQVVKSEPDNKSYYTPGEKIEYEIRIYTEDADIKEMVVKDTLKKENGGELASFSDVEEPGYREAYYDYIVTEEDCENLGAVVNVAYAEWETADGQTGKAYSNPAVSDVGKPIPGIVTLPPPVVVVPDPEKSKKPEEKPGEPTGGETETKPGEPTGGETETKPGEPDGGKKPGVGGKITGGEKPEETVSAPETPETSEDPTVPATEIPAKPVISDPSETASGKSKTELSAAEAIFPAGEADLCRRIFTAEGEGALVYELIFCDSHEAVLTYIKTALSFADTPEKELVVWQQARALWQSRLEDEYRDLKKIAVQETDETLRKEKEEVILKEEEAYQKMLTAYEQDLALLYPLNPEIVARMVAENLEARVFNFCIESTDPFPVREDSYLTEEILSLKLDPLPEKNEILTEELSGDKIRVRLQMAEGFRKVMENMNLVLEKALNTPEDFQKEVMEAKAKAAAGSKKSEEAAEAAAETEEEIPSAITLAFEKCQSLWQREIDIPITKLYLSSAEEQRKAIAEDRKAFGEWIETREALLALFYPERPETVAEILMQEVMNRAIAFAIAVEEAPKG